MTTDPDQNPNRPLPVGPRSHLACRKGCEDASGFIFARPKGKPTEAPTVFRCDCGAGLERKPETLLWSMAKQDDWVRDVLPGQERAG